MKIGSTEVAQVGSTEVVARGGGQSPPELGRSVNPIQTRGQIMPLTLLPAPRTLKVIYTSCSWNTQFYKSQISIFPI